jgi:hypothetical protein
MRTGIESPSHTRAEVPDPERCLFTSTHGNRCANSDASVEFVRSLCHNDCVLRPGVLSIT